MKSLIHKTALLFVMICMSLVNQAYSQVVTDTFGIIGFGAGWGPIDNTPLPSPNTKIRIFVKYRADELAAKGIVPGVIIYGIAFHKNNTATLLPGATGTLNFNMRSGSLDTALNPASWATSTYSTNYFFNNVLGGGFASYMQFNIPNDLTIPSGPGMIPLMLDMPFVYTGGCLEYWSDWESPGQPMSGYAVDYSHEVLPYYGLISYHSPYPLGGGVFGPHRPAAVIYHSIPPLPVTAPRMAGL